MLAPPSFLTVSASAKVMAESYDAAASTYNPFRVALGEYAGIARDVVQRGISLRDRWRYLFAPPGFSHDGSRQDAHMIKAVYLRDRPQEAGTEGLRAPR